MKNTTKLILIWSSVIVISAAAFFFFGGNSLFSKDKVIFNVVTNDYKMSTVNYVIEKFDANPTASDITDITGTSPIPYYIPEGYSLSGVTKLIPLDEAKKPMTNDIVFAEYYTNPASEAYMFSVEVSKSDQFKITQTYSALNRTLNEDTEQWSKLDGEKVKLYAIKDQTQYFALFIKDGHFWRVDAHSLDQQEFLNLVKNLILQQ